MAQDRYASHARSPGLPAGSVAAITPSDVSDLPEITVALNVAAPGAVRVTTLEGDVVDIHVAAGVAFPLRVRRVWATGTTATGIRALF